MSLVVALPLSVLDCPSRRSLHSIPLPSRGSMLLRASTLHRRGARRILHDAATSLARSSSAASAVDVTQLRCQRMHSVAQRNPLRLLPSQSRLSARCPANVSSGVLAHARRSLFGLGKPERVTLHERRLVPFPASVYFDVVRHRGAHTQAWRQSKWGAFHGSFVGRCGMRAARC